MVLRVGGLGWGGFLGGFGARGKIWARGIFGGGFGGRGGAFGVLPPSWWGSASYVLCLQMVMGAFWGIRGGIHGDGGRRGGLGVGRAKGVTRGGDFGGGAEESLA